MSPDLPDLLGLSSELPRESSAARERLARAIAADADRRCCRRIEDAEDLGVDEIPLFLAVFALDLGEVLVALSRAAVVVDLVACLSCEDGA